MQEKSTPFKRLLKYIYQDMPLSDQQEIAQAIATNNQIRNDYNRLIEEVGMLPKLQLAPSNLSIHKVLHHALTANLQAH
jgi:hypothetical protein